MAAIELSPPSRWEKVRRKVAVAGGLVLAATGVVGVSQPASAASPLPFSTPATCTIQTFDTGRYVTAVGGGGQTIDVIHTNATVPQGWETFRVVDAGGGHVGIVASAGYYLTAVGGGGRTTDVIHSNATLLQGWEQFNLVPAPGRPADVFGIQTFDGHYLTAVGGGGQTTDVIHSDATQIGGWEEFRFNCNQFPGTVNIMAWGGNGSGQVGAGAQPSQTWPRSVPGLPRDVTQVAAGAFHSLALRADGTVLAWGGNQFGELGLGSPPDSLAHPTPQPVPGLTAVVQIAAGNGFSLALRKDGTVWGWGDNTSGELGVGAVSTNQLTPTQVQGLAQVTQIAAGVRHGIALLNDRTVRGWGDNQDGELGDGHPTYAPVPIPVAVSGLSGVIHIGAGKLHSLAVLGDGSVRAWGYNGAGELGNGTQSSSSTPVAVAGLTNVVQVDGGEDDSVALRGDGTVWAWGYNISDEVDASGDTFVLTPRRVPGLAGVTQIAAGSYHNLAVRGDGSLWSWGFGGDGERGDGSGQLGGGRVNKSTPVRLVTMAQVVNIAAGGSHSIATAAVSVVPNLQYSDPVSAALFLVDAGLTVGPNTPPTGQCFFGDGPVMGQDIAAGTPVPPGTPVNYFFDCVVP